MADSDRILSNLSEDVLPSGPAYLVEALDPTSDSFHF